MDSTGKTLPRWEEEDEVSAITALLWSFVPYHAVRAADTCALFDELAIHEQLSCEEVATHMGWRVRPAQRLLAILELVGLVYKCESGVCLTARARRWFVRTSPSYVGVYFERAALLERAYQHLEIYLVSDSPDPLLQAATLRAFGLSADATAHDVLEFGQVQGATSTPVAEGFFRLVDIPKEATVLDVGAGTGIFTRKLLENGHRGSIDFLDTPIVCEVVKPQLGEYAPRIQWLPADWHLWQPFKAYDAVFLHHVLHEERHVDAERLIKKCASALAPRGTLYVIGLFERPEHKDCLARYFGMNILLEVGGDNTSLAWLRSIAREMNMQEHTVQALPGGRTLWAATASSDRCS